MQARTASTMVASTKLGDDGDELHELVEASGDGRTPARWRGGVLVSPDDDEEVHAIVEDFLRRLVASVVLGVDDDERHELRGFGGGGAPARGSGGALARGGLGVLGKNRTRRRRGVL